MRRSPQLTAQGSAVGPDQPPPEPEKVSEQLERWLRTRGDKTLGSLFELFEEKGFAILFVLLLGVSALPLPTGGATHVFQIIAVLLALELIAGRDQIWLPRRWRKLELAGDKQQRFITALMKMIRRLERFSRPPPAPPGSYSRSCWATRRSTVSETSSRTTGVPSAFAWLRHSRCRHKPSEPECWIPMTAALSPSP